MEFKCPICNGRGRIAVLGVDHHYYKRCNACNCTGKSNFGQRYIIRGRPVIVTEKGYKQENTGKIYQDWREVR